MATDRRPDPDARERARQAIRAAFATGAIVEADHDQRLRAVDDARTGAELAMVVRGLEPEVPDSWRAYRPVPPAAGGVRGGSVTAPASPTAGDSMEPRGGSEPGSTWLPAASVRDRSARSADSRAVGRRPASKLGLLVAGAAVAGVLAVSGVTAWLGSAPVLDDAVRGVEGLAGRGADVQSADGFTELLLDLEHHTGDTRVYEAALYGDYAIVDVPVAGGARREQGLLYRGSFEEWTKGTSTYELFDLSVVDAEVVPGLCDRAREELIEDPGPDCYVLIRKPTGEDGTWLWAYVSNDFGEGGYLGTDLEGVETTRSTWP